ncbi:succinylglutamate desuccinylase/aspartoacylase family protein [Paraburkholderia youngii]|uniref:succinylglutamate desuccinylase/aspartoacylase family protein n=1 Tax=Paraburkholderia youngii TaxID=2782701 RepID=UPI003D1B1B26
MGARVLILVDNAGGGTFDQAFRDAWRFLKQFVVCSDSSIGLAAVVELRGQRDVSDELAAADAAGLVHFLQAEGIVRSDAVEAVGFDPQVFALNAVAHIATPVAEVISWKAECGDQVEHGETIAEIVACDGNVPAQRTRISASTAGVLIARAHVAVAAPGQRIAMISGNAARPERIDGKLLHD